MPNDMLFVDADTRLGLDALCRGCDVDPAWVMQLVDVGLLPEPLPGPQREFPCDALVVVQRVQRLQRAFGLHLDAVALVIELADSNRRLRARLLGAGIDPD